MNMTQQVPAITTINSVCCKMNKSEWVEECIVNLLHCCRLNVESKHKHLWRSCPRLDMLTRQIKQYLQTWFSEILLITFYHARNCRLHNLWFYTFVPVSLWKISLNKEASSCTNLILIVIGVLQAKVIRLQKLKVTHNCIP